MVRDPVCGMEIEEKEILRQTTRTWYGVPVDITVSSDHWHRVVVPGLALPHPGLVNLREGIL